MRDNPVVMPIFSAPDGDYFAGLRTLEEGVLRFIGTGEGSFEDLILAAHSVQRTLCAPYGAYCKALREPASWREIPAIPLTAFRHAAIRSFPAEETIRSFRTSGTTGEGYGEHHFRTLELYRAAAVGGWQYVGSPNDKSLLSHAVARGISQLLTKLHGWMACPSATLFSRGLGKNDRGAIR